MTHLLSIHNQKPMTMKNVFAGVVLTLAVLLIISGCERPLDQSGTIINEPEQTNQDSQPVEQTDASDQEADELKNKLDPQEPGEPVTKSNPDDNYYFANFDFGFDTDADMNVTSYDRGAFLGYEEEMLVSVDYQLPNEDEQDYTYRQLKPQLTISVYSIADPQSVDAQMAKIVDGATIGEQDFGDKTYKYANVSGLVPMLTYFTSSDDYLYEISLANFPCKYADEDLSEKVNNAFIQVLETFTVN